MKDNNLDLSLYLVTERKDIDLPTFYTTILESVIGGVSIVQLREKDTPEDEFLSIANDLISLLKPLGVPLIINDSIDVALKSGADGVHLGQGDRNIVEARMLLGPKAIIGLSIENLEQMKAAESLDLDYIAASPVFPSTTKTDTATPWGIHGLTELCCLSTFPVVSIGGLNLHNIKNVITAGSSGACVVSAIFNADSPRNAAKQLLDIINKARKL